MPSILNVFFLTNNKLIFSLVNVSMPYYQNFPALTNNKFTLSPMHNAHTHVSIVELENRTWFDKILMGAFNTHHQTKSQKNRSIFFLERLNFQTKNQTKIFQKECLKKTL